LLTQDQLIPGLGNAIAQDILFKAKLHPKHGLDSLDSDQKKLLFDSIKNTIDEITELGGRYDEYDLFGSTGKYIRLMDKNTLKRPCPVCGSEIKKIQYLGGACYFCPGCQN
jgi:formamidopyrimidine-DNA glycosylase